MNPNNSQLPVSGALLLALLMASAPVSARMNKEETVRVDAMEARLARTERLLESQGLQEMYLRLESLDAENRSLRGEIEQMRYQVEQMRQRQRELYLDMDQRLQAVESRASGFGSAPVAEEIPGISGMEAAETARMDEQGQYRTAFELLKGGDNTGAINGFNRFLEQYPESGLASNAQYWLGEASYGARNFSQAVREFEKVRTLYPDSSKVADASLKLAYSYYELKKWNSARSVLQEIQERFSDSTAAKLAQKRLERIKREGH